MKETGMKKTIFAVILITALIFGGCKSDADEADEETYYSDVSEILNRSKVKDKIDEYLERDDVIFMFGSNARLNFGGKSELNAASLMTDFLTCARRGDASDLHVAVYLDDSLGKPYGFDGEELILRDIGFDGKEYKYTEKCVISGRERNGAFKYLKTASEINPVNIDYNLTMAEYCYLAGHDGAKFDDIDTGLAGLYEERDDRFIILLNLYNNGVSSYNGKIIYDPLDVTEAEVFDGIDGSVDPAEALEKLKDRTVVVFDGAALVSGREYWDAFCEIAEEGTAASIPIAHYYTLDPERVSEELYDTEKDNYPQLFLSVLTYDGKGFTLIERERKEASYQIGGEFKYLKKFFIRSECHFYSFRKTV